jgi:Complex I intermediate-associated protein 30 (CIA30)
MDVRVPFADLIPTFRAKTVRDATAFDASQTYSMQLMLSKFEYDGGLNPKFSPGYFELQVESIKAYGEQPAPKLILVGSPDASLEQVVRESGLSYAIIPSEDASAEAIAGKDSSRTTEPKPLGL